MRIVAVAMGIVALVVFSIFLLLAAPISAQWGSTVEMTGFAHRPPPTGILYHVSRAAVRYLWLYFLLVIAVSVAMVVGVLRNKIGDLVVWIFVGLTVLLNILAIASIHLVAEYVLPRF